MRLLAAAALTALCAVTFAQDIAEGTVVAFDRKANVIVLNDKTVWSLDKLQAPLPEALKAGDRIEINYRSNEDDGVTAIDAIKRLSEGS